MMRVLNIIARIVLVLSLIGLLATFVVYSSYASRAQLIQRVEYNELNAKLLGDPGPLIGSPQKMIIADQKAFIDGKGPDGSRLVNDVYLTQNKIYPLQLKTVGYVIGLVRMGLGIAFAVSAIAVFALRRFGQRPTQPANA